MSQSQAHAHKKSPLCGLIQLLTFFGTMAAIEIINPVSAAIISGNMKASDVRKGFFMSKRMTIKNALVAKVEEE
ncbi:hypothetical protein [Enterobacter kobei]|uniref:hypothetical protein n=1 Tax=Enterobacter kobei TaxID=208224 RepID=UPI00200420F1|nr:hypothetical protein [Enterobacter kobei]MCK7105941.1 hypothetical protein [Enterobacter kobei]